jgi:hypothetical protein
MNSSEEIQLTRDLSELAASQPFTPDLDAIEVRARQRHRRGLALRGTAAAGAVVLAAGGFFALHGTGATAAHSGTAVGPTGTASAAAHPGRSGTASAPTRTETVAYVTAKVMAALADVNKYVLREDQLETGPNGHSTKIWTDPRTGNGYVIEHDGSADMSVAWLSTYLVNRVLTWKTIEADYSTRTWFVLVMRAAGPIQGSTAGATSTVMTPAQIKGWLDAGKLKIVGHKEIDGHQAIGLRQPWARGYRELWVDSQTFLPLRTIQADFASMTGPLKNVLLVNDDTWLPRTKSLLDMVNHVHIPAGFTQVPPPQ